MRRRAILQRLRGIAGTRSKSLRPPPLAPPPAPVGKSVFFPRRPHVSRFPAATPRSASANTAISRTAARAIAVPTKPCPKASVSRSTAGRNKAAAPTTESRSASVHFHSRHAGMIHVVMALVVVHGRPDPLRVLLIRIDVYHPAEDVRNECAARRLAGFAGGDRAQQAEFRVRPEVFRLAIRRRLAEIHMLMPARDAQ